NRRFRYLLEQGQTGLSVAFDLPTQIGHDADAPMARGEVGKVGVSISSLRDMEILFDGIPLDRVSTSMTINAPAALLLLLYELVAEQQGVPSSKLSGTVQNDILKEYAARGTYIFPPRPSMRLTTDVFAYCARRIPNWNTISISGYHLREAGSTAVQEVGFTMAHAVAYRAAAAQQHNPGRASVHECRPRRHPEPARLLLRRGPWPAVRGGGNPLGQDPAGDCARNQRAQRRGPAGGKLPGRGPDRPGRIRCPASAGAGRGEG